MLVDGLLQEEQVPLLPVQKVLQSNAQGLQTPPAPITITIIIIIATATTITIAIAINIIATVKFLSTAT